MSKENAIKLLKQALKIGDKTALIREAIKELESVAEYVMSSGPIIFNGIKYVPETRTSCIACHGTGIPQETSVGGHPQRCSICDGTGIKPVPCGRGLGRNPTHQPPRVYPFGKI
jgi:hypothetical protein